MVLMHLEDSGDTSRGGHGSRTEVEDLPGRPKIGFQRIDVTMGIGFTRSLGEEIVEPRASTGRANHGKTASRRRGQDGFREAGSQPASQRGIEGVATAAQRMDRRLS